MFKSVNVKERVQGPGALLINLMLYTKVFHSSTTSILYFIFRTLVIMAVDNDLLSRMKKKSKCRIKSV